MLNYSFNEHLIEQDASESSSTLIYKLNKLQQSYWNYSAKLHIKHWSRSSEEDSMFLLDLMLMGNSNRTDTIYVSENMSFIPKCDFWRILNEIKKQSQ